jgi:hypothetical protein
MSNVQQELIQILATPEIMGDDYFSAKKVSHHFTPASARLFFGISSATTQIYQNASTQCWQGRICRAITEFVVVTGYACCAVIAVAEVICSLALAVVCSTGYLLLGSSSDLLHRYAVKSWGYSTHSACVLALQVLLVNNRIPVEHHSFNCILSHGSYLFSSTLGAHLASKFYLSLLPGSSLPYSLVYPEAKEENAEFTAFTSAAHAFLQNGPLIDLLGALDRDFGEGATEVEFSQQLQTQSLVTFFEHYPEHRAVLAMSANVFKIFESSNRIGISRMASDFVHFSYHPNSYGTSLEPEKAYQKSLQMHVKEAVRRVQLNPLLLSYLSETESPEDGKTALEGYWPQVYVPLAHYAQFCELTAADIDCPAEFMNERLKVYNTRRQELLEARAILEGFSEVEKTELIRKLLSVKDYLPQVSVELQGKIARLLESMHKLAAPLHQGTLMSEFSEAEYVNLFQKAYQEALVM